MQVAIYATEEKRRRAGFDHVLVLARLGEALILRHNLPKSEIAGI